MFPSLTHFGFTYYDREYSVHWQYHGEKTFLDRGLWTGLGLDQTAVCDEVKGRVVCEIWGPPPPLFEP